MKVGLNAATMVWEKILDVKEASPGRLELVHDELGTRQERRFDEVTQSDSLRAAPSTMGSVVELEEDVYAFIDNVQGAEGNGGKLAWTEDSPDGLVSLQEGQVFFRTICEKGVCSSRNALRTKNTMNEIIQANGRLVVLGNDDIWTGSPFNSSFRKLPRPKNIPIKVERQKAILDPFDRIWHMDMHEPLSSAIIVDLLTGETLSSKDILQDADRLDEQRQVRQIYTSHVSDSFKMMVIEQDGTPEDGTGTICGLCHEADQELHLRTSWVMHS